MTDELKQWEYDKGYTKGYSDGRASLIEEFEKTKAEIVSKFIDYDSLINVGLNLALNVIENHIYELKGENK